MKKIKRKYWAFFILSSVLILPVVFPLNTQITGFRVNNGNSKDIYIPGGICKHVTNNSGKDIFIPTKTSNEWAAFRDHHPSGITIAACAAAPVPCARISAFRTYPGVHNCNGGADAAACLAAPWPAGYSGCPGHKACLCTNWSTSGHPPIWSTLNQCCCP